jgi:gamma-glutamyl-gamma-aminobutyrate hydrolase PuuD
MKIVAITQRVDIHVNRKERRDALDQRLNALIFSIGLLPVPVPNGFHVKPQLKSQNKRAFDRWIKVISPGAILLSGGNDFGDFPERDRVENWLLDYAESNDLPALGICRGMQLMALRAGGKIEPLQGHVGTQHQLRGVISGKANSYHNYGLLDCPPKFRVLATSEDSHIEAIRHESLPWEGWMWHPERDFVFSTRDIKRLRALFA